MTLDRRRFLQITAAGVVASLTTSACASDAGVDATALERPELLAAGRAFSAADGIIWERLACTTTPSRVS